MIRVLYAALAILAWLMMTDIVSDWVADHASDPLGWRWVLDAAQHAVGFLTLAVTIYFLTAGALRGRLIQEDR